MLAQIIAKAGALVGEGGPVLHGALQPPEDFSMLLALNRYDF
jgi:hypothetical protein